MASGLHPELETYMMETTLATGPRISSEKLGDRYDTAGGTAAARRFRFS